MNSHFNPVYYIQCYDVLTYAIHLLHEIFYFIAFFKFLINVSKIVNHVPICLDHGPDSVSNQHYVYLSARSSFYCFIE